ncbi:MAG: hypothetical protein ACW98I_07565 [Candidatus Hodarchaeales archaeon]|jgi:hypothetical protein
MNYDLELPEELVNYFDSIFTLFDLGFTDKENMLKHVLLEGLEHRLEHLAENQSFSQHKKYHNLIDTEKAKCVSSE